MAGQSVMDRVAAVKHSIAGQGLAKSVCKATTEEIIGPKKKHLDYLLQCTNEPNVSIPQMADLLIERTQHTSWVVVFKSLISIHNLMNLGNERFTQYLASNNCSFNLSGFVDKGGVQGYDMSTYIRRYAKYLNEKAVSYRLMAFDFCKVKRGKDDGLLRTMNSEKLLRTLPVLQQQLDALLEFDCTPNELTNGVITACFMLLFKDLIRLFACYNDGIINLLEKYFDMNKKQCKDALDLYKKFLVRMDKVSEFLKVAENMGIDKGDIPDLAKGLKGNSSSAPASLLDALEQHLASLEGKKSATTPTGSAKPSGFTTALNNMSSNTFNVSDAEKKRILEEESQQLQKHKGVHNDQKLKENTSPQKSSTAANNPFSSPPGGGGQQPPQQDLFGSPVDHNAKASDDLLSLSSNPFAGNVQNVMAGAYQTPATGSNPFGTTPFQTNGYSSTTNANNFDADFAKAFNNTNNTGPNAQDASFGTGSGGAPTSSAPPGFDAFGEVMAPMNKSPSHQVAGVGGQATKPLGGDLDSSLASLASNLNVSGGTGQLKKDHQWQPKGENKLTGGNSFQRQPIATSTTNPNPNPPQWGAQPGFQQPNMMAGVPGGPTPMMYGQQMGMPMGQPMMGMTPQPMGMQQPGMMAAMGQPPMMYGAVPPPHMAPAASPGMAFNQQQHPASSQQPPSHTNVNDPFGAL